MITLNQMSRNCSNEITQSNIMEFNIISLDCSFLEDITSLDFSPSSALYYFFSV